MFSAVIVCAGSGSRVGLGYNKLLYKYNNETILEKSVKTFLNHKLFNEVIVVVSDNDFDEIKELLKDTNAKLIIGGTTRQESVLNGVKNVNNQYVFIHDGARCFLTSDKIDEMINEINKTNLSGYALAVKSIDSLLVVEDNYISSYLNREIIYNMQTPQVVKVEEFLSIKNYNNETDEASLMSNNGFKVKIIEGCYSNKKITVIKDLGDLNE